MPHNRTDAARTLLNDVEAWCARTGTRESAVGHVLFLHPGFVGLLRLRLTVSEEKEIAVRDFIFCRHPDGYRGELPKTHGNGTRPLTGLSRFKDGCGLVSVRLSEDEIAARQVEHGVCLRCGSRLAAGCRHNRMAARL